MKKSRFSEEQLVKMLREADAASVAEVSKKYSVSSATLYGWRQRFGGMNVDETRRFKTLESENGRRKKLLAERNLEIELMKEVAAKMVSTSARR